MSRYSNAIWQPTPKHGYPSTDIHAGDGVVIHSAEGSLASAIGVINGPREASWHFFVCKDGKVYQFVDTANIAWTNGSFESNKKFWGIENEGGGPDAPGEPLTAPQFESLWKLVKWLLGPLPHVRGQTLFEHNEMTAYGSLPTACPSGRIPWNGLIVAMKEDEMLDPADPVTRAAFASLMDWYLTSGAAGTFGPATRSTDAKYGGKTFGQVVGEIVKTIHGPHSAGGAVPALKVHIPAEAGYDVPVVPA